MSTIRVKIRASSVPEWADCQARADYTVKRAAAPGDRPHVGAVVGSLVHQRLTGQEFELPRFIEWDAWTRNEREMERQVDVMADLAGQELTRRNALVVFKELEMTREMTEPNVVLEVTGHLDGAMMDVQSHALASLELKTGIHPPKGAWLQSGVYAWLWRQHRSLQSVTTPQFQKCVVLWLDRKGERVTWQERDAAPLEHLAGTQLSQIARACVEGVTYNPSSLSCSSCLNTQCAVRYDAK